MKTYTVSHTVEIECDSPEEAARIFLDFIRDEDTDEDGNAFTVKDDDTNEEWTVVLYEDECEVTPLEDEA